MYCLSKIQGTNIINLLLPTNAYIIYIYFTLSRSMQHLLLLRDCNLSRCTENNTKETNSFNPTKCTILRSYIHSKPPTYMAYSSVFVTHLCSVYVTILHNTSFSHTYPLYAYCYNTSQYVILSHISTVCMLILYVC